MRTLVAGFALAMFLTWGVWMSPVAAAPAPGGTAEKPPAVKSETKSAKDRSAGRVLSDVTITSKVKAALIQDETVSAREINVDTVTGIVHLRGKVDSKAQARKAVAIAKKVEGVKAVKSHLKIVPDEKTASGKGRSVGRVASDVTITGKVKAALIQDKTVQAREINVDTVKGIVHLKGSVDTKAAAHRALALAQNVEGVRGVKSHLKVGPSEKTAGHRSQSK